MVRTLDIMVLTANTKDTVNSQDEPFGIVNQQVSSLTCGLWLSHQLVQSTDDDRATSCGGVFPRHDAEAMQQCMAKCPKWEPWQPWRGAGASLSLYPTDI